MQRRIEHAANFTRPGVNKYVPRNGQPCRDGRDFPNKPGGVRRIDNQFRLGDNQFGIGGPAHDVLRGGARKSRYRIESAHLFKAGNVPANDHGRLPVPVETHRDVGPVHLHAGKRLPEADMAGVAPLPDMLDPEMLRGGGHAICFTALFEMRKGGLRRRQPVRHTILDAVPGAENTCFRIDAPIGDRPGARRPHRILACNPATHFRPELKQGMVIYGHAAVFPGLPFLRLSFLHCKETQGNKADNP